MLRWLALLCVLLPVFAACVVVALLVGNGLPKAVILFTSSRDNGSYNLYLLDIRVGISRKLSDFVMDLCCPVWSPDGEKLLLPTGGTGDFKIYVMDWDGGNLRRVTDAAEAILEYNPVWSSDGRQFAFITTIQGSRIPVIASLADSSYQQRTNMGSWPYLWGWTDDDTLLMSREADDHLNMELGLVGVHSGESRVLQISSLGMSILISPDGDYILYSRHADEQPDLYIMRTDGTDEQRLTTSGALEMFPSWSPDGTRILFASEQDGSMELYTVAVADGSLTRLTRNSATDWTPSWSPDGRYILFASDRDGDAEIYVMNADGSDQRRLTFNRAVDAYPAWQP